MEKTKSFKDPLNKMKLKTFANKAKSEKVVVSTNKAKELTTERNVFGQLVLLT